MPIYTNLPVLQNSVQKCSYVKGVQQGFRYNVEKEFLQIKIKREKESIYTSIKPGNVLDTTRK